jgi:hypothetical protein
MKNRTTQTLCFQRQTLISGELYRKRVICIKQMQILKRLSNYLTCIKEGAAEDAQYLWTLMRMYEKTNDASFTFQADSKTPR